MPESGLLLIPLTSEAELQRRVLDARADQRNQFTNLVQTAGIGVAFLASVIAIMVT